MQGAVLDDVTIQVEGLGHEAFGAAFVEKQGMVQFGVDVLRVMEGDVTSACVWW